MTPTSRRSRTAVTAVALILVAALTSCSRSPAESPYTMSDAWVKSVDSGMTAAFGVLTNTTSETVTVVSAKTSAASKVELHEVVMGADGSMVMQPKPGGFEIGPHQSLTLEPGGFHIMLMGVTAPIAAGDDITIELTMSNGKTLTFHAIAKDFAGANETYTGTSPTNAG